MEPKDYQGGNNHRRPWEGPARREFSPPSAVVLNFMGHLSGVADGPTQ